MRRADIQSTFDQIQLSDDRKKEIFHHIRDKSAEKNVCAQIGIWKALVSAAAVFLVIGVSVMGVDAATDGKISNAIKGLFGLNTDTPEVVHQAEQYISIDMIFAPDVVYLDEETLIFSTGRAVFIYDRQDWSRLQTIDLQKTDCIYWNVSAGEIHTHALYDDGEIWVFNDKNGQRYGKFYHYDLSAEPSASGMSSEESEDDTVWNEIYARWENEAAKYVDTFRTFEEIGLGEQQIHPNDSVYSEHSYSYRNAEGADYLAYLTVPSDEKGIPTEKKFILNLYDRESGETSTEEVQLESYTAAESDVKGNGTGEETKQTAPKLPEFAYTGDDPVLKPICDYMVQQGTENYYLPDGSVCIPAFVIYDKIERDGSLYVFGNFWIHNYYQNGNTLEDISGGAYPARFELRQNNPEVHGRTYEILEITVAGDGADYDKDIRKFTEGFDGVYQKYFGDWEQTQAAYQETRKEYIRMYEEQNHLGIKYYKDYGWEPVAIYE